MTDPHGSGPPNDDEDDLAGTDPNTDEPTDDDGLAELRQAAGAVLASLKWLVDAAERVVEDPHAFDQVIATGRGVVEAFTSGFTSERSATDGANGPEESR